MSERYVVDLSSTRTRMLLETAIRGVPDWVPQELHHKARVLLIFSLLTGDGYAGQWIDLRQRAKEMLDTSG